MPEVLRSVQQMAVSSKLKINRLKPEPVIRRPFCSDWPIHIEATGNCDGLGLFFERISRATRIINVEAISIKASDNPTDTVRTLTAGFTVTVFVFSEEAPETLEDNEEQVERSFKSPTDYSGIRYTPHSGRDPFLDLLLLRKQPLPNNRKMSPRPLSSGIAGTPIAELRFEGISLGNGKRLAIIRAADGHAYFLKEGDRLFDGYLKVIQSDSIVLVRETKLSSGKILTQDVTRRLRKR
jgi:Tfp pilus assembly protein PilP